MSDPPETSPPSSVGVPKPVPPAEPDEPVHGRRDFFGEALREVLGPLSGLLERRITPVLEALERLPGEVESTVGLNTTPGSGPLDQPQASHDVPLPMLPARKKPERFLRPPGSLPPGEYESVCSRCGKCAEVCPAHAIKLDPAGIVGEGAPYIVAGEAPCVICDSLSCMHFCPSGALTLVDKFSLNMGLAKVDQHTCLRARGDHCTVCIDSCPLGEKAIGLSPYTGRVAVKRNGCVGCGVCEQMCPTQPRSIIVQPFEIKPDPLIA